MNIKKLSKSISIVLSLTIMFTGCAKKDTRDIERKPAPCNYIEQNPSLSNITSIDTFNNIGYDLLSANLKNADLSNDLDLLMSSSFDSQTIFPDSLPDGFNPDDNKIRVISISMGGENPDTKGYDTFIQALKDAHDEGIFVLTTGLGDGRDDIDDSRLQYMGLGRISGIKGINGFCFGNLLKNLQVLHGKVLTAQSTLMAAKPIILTIL